MYRKAWYTLPPEVISPAGKEHTYGLICTIKWWNCCQSINQSISFYFLLSATSSMHLALYNGTHTLVWTHTYTYTVKYITHTSIHTRQPFRRRYNVFISGTHTLTLVASAFLILGNPSLVLKSPPGVPPSMLQPRQHHSRPTLIQPLVALLSLQEDNPCPDMCPLGIDAFAAWQP